MTSFSEGPLRSLLPTMTRNTSMLGGCPECREAIPRAWLLIEYERGDGTTGVWAECPDCEAVVSPE